jgi:hypothetical protein
MSGKAVVVIARSVSELLMKIIIVPDVMNGPGLPRRGNQRSNAHQAQSPHPTAESGSIGSSLGPSKGSVITSGCPPAHGLLKPGDYPPKVCRQRLLQHAGSHALKVASPCQLDAVVKLLLGKRIDRAVFHHHATIAG